MAQLATSLLNSDLFVSDFDRNYQIGFSFKLNIVPTGKAEVP